MSRIVWDNDGERLYETGVDRAVLYPYESGGYGKGVAWNGITAYNESPSGAEATKIYADNIQYLNLVSAEEFGASIEAYTYPDEFAECDGSVALAPGVYAGQQTRKKFGFTCRTLLGNDEVGNDFGYKLHIVYNCLAAPSEKGYATVNDSPEAINFSWTISTTPAVIGEGYKPAACITIDSTKADPAKLTALEDLLYGTVSAEPELPSISRIMSMMAASSEPGETDTETDPETDPEGE